MFQPEVLFGTGDFTWRPVENEIQIQMGVWLPESFISGSSVCLDLEKIHNAERRVYNSKKNNVKPTSNENRNPWTLQKLIAFIIFSTRLESSDFNQ